MAKIFNSKGILALFGFYLVSSAAFVVSRIRRAKLQLFEIPVFITVTCFMQFGLIPLRNFIDPTQLDVNLISERGRTGPSARLRDIGHDGVLDGLRAFPAQRTLAGFPQARPHEAWRLSPRRQVCC